MISQCLLFEVKHPPISMLTYIIRQEKLTAFPIQFYNFKLNWIPSSVIWGMGVPKCLKSLFERHVIKIKGRCGSCWAFAATGAMEGQQFIRTGSLVSLSEQNLLDCAWFSCSGGWAPDCFDYVAGNGGIDTASSYLYAGVQGSCR